MYNPRRPTTECLHTTRQEARVCIMPYPDVGRLAWEPGVLRIVPVNKQLRVRLHVKAQDLVPSVAVLAEISLESPRKLGIVSIKK